MYWLSLLNKETDPTKSTQHSNTKKSFKGASGDARDDVDPQASDGFDSFDGRDVFLNIYLWLFMILFVF